MPIFSDMPTLDCSHWGRLQQILRLRMMNEMDSFREEEATEFTAFLLKGCKKIRLVSFPKQENIIEFDVVG